DAQVDRCTDDGVGRRAGGRGNHGRLVGRRGGGGGGDVVGVVALAAGVDAADDVVVLRAGGGRQVREGRAADAVADERRCAGADAPVYVVAGGQRVGRPVQRHPRVARRCGDAGGVKVDVAQ